MDSNDKKSILIGVTGGIASGKSTIINYLNEKGYSTIEADKLGHKILEPKNPSYTNIVEIFGKDILDKSGTINRQILGEIVFSDHKKLKQLNDISHPAICKMIKQEYKELSTNSLDGIIFLEAALLIETGWYKLCDQIWVVILEPFIATKRLQLRDGLSEEEAETRLKTQISPEKRVDYADLVLNNSKSSKNLLQQTESALNRLKYNYTKGYI